MVYATREDTVAWFKKLKQLPDNKVWVGSDRSVDAKTLIAVLCEGVIPLRFWLGSCGTIVSFLLKLRS